MRALTIEEKAQSKAARKIANKALADARKKTGSSYVWDQHYRMIKGSPATVRLVGGEITLNYELLRGMLRKLKDRRVDIRFMNAYLRGGSDSLAIYHSDLWSFGKGEIELFNLPDYQRILLSDLPIIEID